MILACGYDVFVSITDKDFLVPDSKAYSIRGRCVSLLLQWYDDKECKIAGLFPNNKVDREIFNDTLVRELRYTLPAGDNETNVFSYIIAFLYSVLSYNTIWPRIFNIVLSICSVYFIFKVAKRQFGDTAANLFLLVALFLPTQFGYSITLSRDFLRVFIVSSTIWVIYG